MPLFIYFYFFPHKAPGPASCWFHARARLLAAPDPRPRRTAGTADPSGLMGMRRRQKSNKGFPKGPPPEHQTFLIRLNMSEQTEVHAIIELNSVRDEHARGRHTNH